MDFILVWIMGICIGSFLNVCIYRIPENISIVTPRSRCGSCGTELKPLDLIPIFSYVFLKGKCRHCGVHFSVRYPLIEALTGLLFVMAYARFEYSATTVIMMFFVSLLVVVFFIDLDHMIIPNKIVLFGLVAGLCLTGYHLKYGYALYESSSPFAGLIGMAVGSGILMLIALISMLVYGGNSGIGMGDVKIYLVIGLFLGWKLTLLSLWLTFILGGIIGLFLILVLKKDRKMAIPFGPFIVIGSVVSAFYGSQIIEFVIFR